MADRGLGQVQIPRRRRKTPLTGKFLKRKQLSTTQYFHSTFDPQLLLRGFDCFDEIIENNF